MLNKLQKGLQQLKKITGKTAEQPPNKICIYLRVPKVSEKVKTYEIENLFVQKGQAIEKGQEIFEVKYRWGYFPFKLHQKIRAKYPCCIDEIYIQKYYYVSSGDKALKILIDNKHLKNQEYNNSGNANEVYYEQTEDILDWGSGDGDDGGDGDGGD